MENEEKLQDEIVLHAPSTDEEHKQVTDDTLLSAESKSISVNTATVSELNNDDVDTKLLWPILNATQCPLIPDQYDEDGTLCSIYYFNDAFWKQCDGDDGSADCRKVLLADDDGGCRHRKCKDDAELMLAVDRYTSNVSINTSLQLYDKLKIALREKTTDYDDGDSRNDVYQKLVPTKLGRLMFLSVSFTSTLNGYFIAESIRVASQGAYGSQWATVLALVMTISEAILFCNLFLVDIVVNSLIMAYRAASGQTTYVQTKTIALQLRNLSTLSILRYLPSIEIVSAAVVNWKETLAKISSGMILVLKNSLTNVENSTKCGAGTLKTVLDIIFAIPCYIIEVFAPLLAVYAILVKIKQLSFVIDSEPFGGWGFSEYLTFIGFLNQVAGLRVLRNIEKQSIQHFVFSGHDAELDTDELLLLDKWWNVTVLSAVSSLQLGLIDNMVFWYSLDPRKIQLLLKHHALDAGAGDSDTLTKLIEANDDILIDYDQKVMQQLKVSSQKHE